VTVLGGLWVLPCMTAIGFYGLAMAAAARFSASKGPADRTFHPPVTVFKPVCGVEPDTYECLASFCRQDYPVYQVIVGVHHAADPGVAVVERLRCDFPSADLHLVISAAVIGANPKVSNLANMAPAARYPLWLVSDSDIQAPADYLRRLVQPMRDPRVGAVTSVCRMRTTGWVSALEALRISTDFNAGVLVARQLERGMRFAFGSAILIHRRAFEAAGGFSGLADYLADDFHVGRMLAAAGYRVELSPCVVEHAPVSGGFIGLLRRQLRWFRGVRVSRPWGYAGLVFTFGIPMSLLGLWATRGAPLAWAVAAVVWTARGTMAYMVGARGSGDPAVSRWWWLIPLQDLLGAALWGLGFLGNTVEWRGQRFRVSPEGKLVPIPAQAARL